MRTIHTSIDFLAEEVDSYASESAAHGKGPKSRLGLGPACPSSVRNHTYVPGIWPEQDRAKRLKI
eukprot:scaffold21847_cov19-Tisochrysis_lutea.AAC.1